MSAKKNKEGKEGKNKNVKWADRCQVGYIYCGVQFAVEGGVLAEKEDAFSSILRQARSVNLIGPFYEE